MALVSDTLMGLVSDTLGKLFPGRAFVVIMQVGDIGAGLTWGMASNVAPKDVPRVLEQAAVYAKQRPAANDGGAH